MTTTPHHVGQITKAELTIADPLERWGLTDPTDRARYLLQQLQALGWTPPRDPNADKPPLRPAQPADDNSPGRQAFRAARQALANRTRPQERSRIRARTEDSSAGSAPAVDVAADVAEERVARAIHQEQNRGAHWELTFERVREEYRRLARAALAAMPPADDDLVMDALEAMWHRAPARRAEVERAMAHRGWWHDHDPDDDCPAVCPAERLPLAGCLVSRAELRQLLAEEAAETEASADGQTPMPPADEARWERKLARLAQLAQQWARLSPWDYKGSATVAKARAQSANDAARIVLNVLDGGDLL